MFKIIRAGTEYRVVVVVTPADAGPETQDAKYFQRQDWATDHNPANQFYEIKLEDVLCAFSGHADGWGFAERPKTNFASLVEIETWISTQQKKPEN